MFFKNRECMILDCDLISVNLLIVFPVMSLVMSILLKSCHAPNFLDMEALAFVTWLVCKKVNSLYAIHLGIQVVMLLNG